MTLTTLGVLASTTLTSAADESQEPALEVGHWVGALVFQAGVSFPDIDGTVAAHGSFDLVVADDGQSTAGDWSFIADGSGQSAGSNFDFTMTVEGPVIGTATQPVLEYASGNLTGTIDAMGSAYPVSFPIGKDGAIPLHIEGASCDMADGVWNVEGVARVESLGGIVSGIRGRWSAVRTDDPGGDVLLEAMNQLVSDAQDQLAAVESGTFDVEAWRELTSRAENMADSFSANAVCTRVEEGHFRSVIAHVVTEMLEAMAANPGAFTAHDFHEAIFAGLKSGVLGAGATSAGATELTNKLVAALTALLDLAVAENDDDSVFDVMISAKLLGADDLVVEANSHLEESVL